MIHRQKSVPGNGSIVPSVFSGLDSLEAKRNQAAQCFDTYEKLRYLIISSERSGRITNNLKDKDRDADNKKPRRKSRTNHRRDFSEASTYIHPATGIEFEINNKAGQGIYVSMMDSAVDQLMICFNKWKRVTAIRMDLHTRDPEPDNKMISKLFKSVNKKLRNRFPRHKELGYLWAAETGSKSKKKHYHLHLFLNGNCVSTSDKVLPMVKASWEGIKAGNTVAPSCRYGYIKNMEALQSAVYAMSYLAKAKDKGFQAKNANDYSASRLQA